MEEDSLFRQAALEARQTQWLGKIILIRPITYTLLCAAVAVAAVVVLLFFFFSSYTRRTTVTGQLLPNAGLIRVYAPQSGLVIERHVKEGQAVKRGDVLYVLSGERQSNAQTDVQAAISQQVETRHNSLRDTLGRTRLLSANERESLEKRISSLDAELEKVNHLIADQGKRVQLAQDVVQRYRAQLPQGEVSPEQMQQREEDLLDQRAKLHSLEREQVGIQRELTAQKIELKALPLKQGNQLAAMERDMVGAAQELTESEARRYMVVTAPESGIVTALSADIGQSVVPGNTPMAIILPGGSELIAHLYVPSRAIGFINPGDKVLLRYQAYPYQKFGHHAGYISQVARTALPSAELPGADAMAVSRGESLYRITVKLPDQAIQAYGKPHQLQAGMLLDADIMQESRRLSEWALEPLYSMNGNM